MSTKMTIYEFRRLSDEEQYSLIFTEGTFIDSKIHCQRFALYAVDMFFIEVEYDNEKNSIIGKKAFITGKLLEKYSYSIE